MSLSVHDQSTTSRGSSGWADGESREDTVYIDSSGQHRASLSYPDNAHTSFHGKEYEWNRIH